MTVRGLLLAAGQGRRMGRPKALVDDWLVRSIGALRNGGCDQVTVVLGAAADEARALLKGLEGAVVEVVVAEDWADGMGASLRAGLRTLLELPVEAALVSLVDLPDVDADVVRRVLAAEVSAGSLRRASYDGTPGHPVLIGREHWAPIIDGAEGAEGDRGARDYLKAHPHELVECGDLATGADIDEPTSGQPAPE